MELYLAPADGKIVVVEETIENEYFKDKRSPGFNFYVTIIMSIVTGVLFQVT